MLDLTYTISNREKTISIDNHPHPDWLYLDKLTLSVGDQFEIDECDQDISHHLKLYQKRENVHIFSGISYIEEKYAAFVFPYYLVWVNNTNAYCFIQNNQKIPNFKDKNNRNTFPEKNLENLFNGLFETRPIYYLESTSRCKGINNISELPYPLKAVVVEEHNDAEVPHSCISFEPI